jgi:TDG/mug DNA glycosylase family protein
MSAAPDRKASFPPFVDERTRVLVLGSLPGEVSLARGQYYAHPQNQFWRLMQAVIGHPLVALHYDDRRAALKAAGVGVWDVLRSARRAGSLDAAIRDHEPNALPALVDALPALKAVGFNGATSAKIGMPLLAGRENLALIALPSSSPAYTLAFDSKLERWMALAAFL